MLIMYAVYCVCLTYNTPLEKWAQTWPVPCKAVQQENEDQHLVSYKSLEEKEGYSATQQQGQQPAATTAVPNGGQQPPQQQGQQPAKPEYYKAKEQTNQVHLAPNCEKGNRDKLDPREGKVEGFRKKESEVECKVFGKRGRGKTYFENIKYSMQIS